MDEFEVVFDELLELPVDEVELVVLVVPFELVVSLELVVLEESVSVVEPDVVVELPELVELLVPVELPLVLLDDELFVWFESLVVPLEVVLDEPCVEDELWLEVVVV